MLVLARKKDQSIVIQTEHGPITVKMLSADGEYVRLGFDAPREVRILRAEIIKTEPALTRILRFFASGYSVTKR